MPLQTDPVGHLRAQAGGPLGRQHPQARPGASTRPTTPTAGRACPRARSARPGREAILAVLEPAATRGSLLREPQRRHPRVQRDARRAQSRRRPLPAAARELLSHGRPLPRRRAAAPRPALRPRRRGDARRRRSSRSSCCSPTAGRSAPRRVGAAGRVLHAALALAGARVRARRDRRRPSSARRSRRSSPRSPRARSSRPSPAVTAGREARGGPASLLALGTTLAAAAQAWSGEAAATCAVAVAVLLLVRSRAEDDRRPGRARRPAARPRGGAPALDAAARARARRSPSSCAGGAGGLRRPRLGRARRRSVALAASGRRRGADAAAATGPWPALALLASPAKGALVFAPVALVGLVGLLRALRSPARRLWDQPPPGRLLPIACGLAVVAHLAWLAAVGRLGGGDFWGPRLVAPAWPLLLLFLPEGFAVARAAARPCWCSSRSPSRRSGRVSYDGRWDRLHPGPAGGAATWDVERSPIVFQARERVARVARPGARGPAPRRSASGSSRPRGASGSFVSFATTPLGPTGVDATMSALRLEAGARASRAARVEGAGRRARLPRARRRAPAAARDPDRRPRDGHPRPRRERLRAGTPAGAIAPSPAPSASASPTTTRTRAARTCASPCARAARCRSSRSPSCPRPSRTTSSACRSRLRQADAGAPPPWSFFRRRANHSSKSPNDILPSELDSRSAPSAMCWPSAR